MFRLNAPVALMTMGVFSLNISKLFSKLKLVTDNHPLCVYGSAYSENLGVGQPCSQVNVGQENLSHKGWVRHGYLKWLQYTLSASFVPRLYKEIFSVASQLASA